MSHCNTRLCSCLRVRHQGKIIGSKDFIRVRTKLLGMCYVGDEYDM